MALKLLLAAVITAGCTYVGIVVSAKYRIREQIFSDTFVFLDTLKSQIAFRRLPLEEILRQAQATVSGPLAGLLGQVIRLYEDGGYVDYTALNQALSCRYLGESERKLYAQLFDTLGKSDCRSQLDSIEGFASAFSRLHDHAREDKRKFSGMYTKLGVLCGLGLAVLVF